MTGLNMYNEVGVYSEVLGANSHRQIQLLLDKTVSQLRLAIIAIDNQEIPEKCRRISSANSIVMYLQDCLNFNDTSSIALRLSAIYDHLEKQLFLANAGSDPAILNQCIIILNNIQTWWNNVAE